MENQTEGNKVLFYDIVIGECFIYNGVKFEKISKHEAVPVDNIIPFSNYEPVATY